jgi:phage gp46-like protein
MDIGIAWDQPTGHGDWSFANFDLARGNDLASAVYVSLFSDGRADPDFRPPDGTGDRRGWWADTYFPGRSTGSRLWTLDRAKKTDDRTLLNQARDICREALQWLIDDRVVAKIDIETLWKSGTALGIGITLTKPDGVRETLNFAWAWDTPGG